MTSIEQSAAPVAEKPFDVGINEKLPVGQLILGFQNIFGMTGMFVFPGILGRAFHLSPDQIAYLYGMTFMVCGLITILQSVSAAAPADHAGPYAAVRGPAGGRPSRGRARRGLSARSSSLEPDLVRADRPDPGFSVIGLFARFMQRADHRGA